MVLGMPPITALAASSEGRKPLGEVNIYNGEQKLSYPLHQRGASVSRIYTYFNHVDANGRTKEIPAYCVNRIFTACRRR